MTFTFISIELQSLRIGAGANSTFSGCLRRESSRPFQLPTQLPLASPSRIYCSFALMAEEKKECAFDGEKAAILVKELRMQFNSGKTRGYDWRIAQLKSISKMVDEREKDIIQALQKDLSKPEFEAFVSEISMIKSSCKLAMQELKHWMKPEKVKTPLTTYPSSAEIVSEPLGVVLVISTWNYPFLLSLDPVIGAIAAGNAVVLKPSEIAPATSSLLANLLREYVDNTSVKVIEGNGRVGRIVMAAAAKHLTPVILELGGKCPTIVDSNVNLQVAARRIIAGKWACNNGQTCVATDYIITPKDFAPKLIDALRHELEEFFGKDPMTSKDISTIVNEYHFIRLMKLMEEDGVYDKIVLGGQADVNQLKIAPTILLDVPHGSHLMTEEIFGPLLPIVTVENVEQSFDLINSKPKPLAAYLFSNNEQLKTKFVNNVSAGGLLMNDTILHLTVPALPFGGVGESGMGCYHGKFSFDSFSHKKSVLYRSFNADSSVRYPPYTSQKLNLLKALMSGSIFRVLLSLIGWSKD